MKAKHGLIIFIVILFVVSSFILSCAPSTPASTKTIELNYNKMGPATQKNSQEPAEYLANEVAKRTNGRVKITIHPNSALAAPPQTYDALLKGVSDIGESQSAYTPGRFPATEIGEIPLGYPNSWVASHAFNDWFNKFKPKEWDESVMVYMFNTTPYVIGTVNKPMQKVDDLKGMILRSSGAASDAYVKALGATPRALGVTEVYEALSKAMLDGLVMPMEAYPPFKLDEVIKYVTDTSFASYAGCSFVAMNKNSFNKLSSGDQKILLEVAKETMEMRSTMFLAETDKAIAKFKALPGRQWITLPADEQSKVKAAAQSVVDNWVKQKTAAGLPAAEYVKYMKERLDYWSQKQPK
jgi:TRAP-type C4-dicarboxylate transport system substrate-binding protein